MELPTDFVEFLKEIRPTAAQRGEMKDGHQRLRGRLKNDKDLAPILVADFLQGSYRRATAVRPKGDKRSDVDIIVVTNLRESENTPEQAIHRFIPFCEKHYPGKYKKNGRSIAIELSKVSLDLVVTSAPSEQQTEILKAAALRTDESIEDAPDWRFHPGWISREQRLGYLSELQRSGMAKAVVEPEWKTEPLRIPDREAEEWDSTHPIDQLVRTRDKNASCNGHFVNVVKAVKWWRLENYDSPERPKGYPLERLVFAACPDKTGSVAAGLTATLETIATSYQDKPELLDLGLLDHGIRRDVLARITEEDYEGFHRQVEDGAKLARRALDATDRDESRCLWRELLGPKFPGPSNGGSRTNSGYTDPSAPAVVGPGRFA